MARTVRVHELDGTLVLDLSTGGYQIISVAPAARAWRRTVTSSPYFDGVLETGAVLDAAEFEVNVLVSGDDWAETGSRWTALLNAVEAPAWLLVMEVDGHMETYRARAADSASSLVTAELIGMCRTVALTIPVQPLEV